MAFFRRHEPAPAAHAPAWLGADGLDWPALERSALVARSLGRPAESDDARARAVLASTPTAAASSAPALAALTALDTIARSGGERVRSALSSSGWPAVLARLASQPGGGPSLAATQLLVDWSAAFGAEALGFEAAAELRSLAQTAPRGSALAAGVLAGPTEGARAARAAAATTAAAGPPSPSAPAERGTDFLNGFLSLPVTLAVAETTTSPGPTAPPPRQQEPAPSLPEPPAALVDRFAAATARLTDLSGQLRAAVGPAGRTAAPPPDLVATGDAAAAEAAGFARAVQAAVSAGAGEGTGAAELAAVLDALDALNSARLAWGESAARVKAAGPLGASAVGLPPPPPPPPPPPQPSSGSFWARFDDVGPAPPPLIASHPVALPPSPPTPAMQVLGEPEPEPAPLAAPAPPVAALAQQQQPPPRPKPLPPLPRPSSPSAAAFAAYARQPHLRVRLTADRFARLAAGLQDGTLRSGLKK